MRFLKISTATIVHLGPFVDLTDGTTLETALSASANQLELYKAEATAAVDVSARTLAHIGSGIYRLSLLAADLDTAGPLVIHAHMTGARSVVHEFNVLHADAYNSLISGTPLPANVTQIAANGIAAVNQAFAGVSMKQFSVGSGSTVDRIATDLTQSITGHWKDRTMVLFSGTLAGQAARITGYNGATKELTVEGLTQAPSAGDTAIIV